MERRDFLLGSMTAAAAAGSAGAVAEASYYGLIQRFHAEPGQREALVQLFLEAVHNLPGCLSYIIARDSGDHDAIWITEVWVDEKHHDAALSNPKLTAAIAKGKSMIASGDTVYATTPVGGIGLRPHKSV